MLVSDHPHLFETGGENYHTDFVGLGLRARPRGRPVAHRAPTRRWVGAPAAAGAAAGSSAAYGDDLGLDRAYDRSRTWFRAEADFPGPRTMAAAAGLAAHSATPHHDRFLLFVDEFDPHEPFDTPEPWARPLRRRAWEGERADLAAVRRRRRSAAGRSTSAEARHIRANYGAKLSMIDHWFGRVLAALDDQRPVGRRPRSSSAPTTATTSARRGGDDIWGKPGVPQYEPLGHIPLLVHWPGVGRRRRPATRSPPASTSTPRWPTSSASTAEHRTHGRSLVPLLDGRRHRGPRLGARRRLGQLGAGHRRPPQVRPGAGRATTSRCRCGRTAGRRCRCTIARPGGLPRPDGRAVLDSMPGSDVPGDPPAVRRRATRSRSGPDGAASTTTTSTTSTSTPTRRRTAPAARRRAPS